VDLRAEQLPRADRKRDWARRARPARARQAGAGEPLLQVEAVRKQFGGLVAVNDVSFEIRPATSWA
jgi:branched-chain amino acid transport system permease protein